MTRVVRVFVLLAERESCLDAFTKLRPGAPTQYLQDQVADTSPNKGHICQDTLANRVVADLRWTSGPKTARTAQLSTTNAHEALFAVIVPKPAFRLQLVAKLSRPRLGLPLGAFKVLIDLAAGSWSPIQKIAKAYPSACFNSVSVEPHWPLNPSDPECKTDSVGADSLCLLLRLQSGLRSGASSCSILAFFVFFPRPHGVFSDCLELWLGFPSTKSLHPELWASLVLISSVKLEAYRLPVRYQGSGMPS